VRPVVLFNELYDSLIINNYAILNLSSLVKYQIKFRKVYHHLGGE
jgi:hypothetical protein